MPLVPTWSAQVLELCFTACRAESFVFLFVCLLFLCFLSSSNSGTTLACSARRAHGRFNFFR